MYYDKLQLVNVNREICHESTFIGTTHFKLRYLPEPDMFLGNHH